MSQRVCPWWLAFTLGNPLRRLLQDPDVILRGLVQPGQTVADIGCGPGFFSIPMARMVGPGGRVICIDLQCRMLDMVARKARRLGFSDRIVLHECGQASIDWSQPVDFALTFAIAHEVPDQVRFLREVASILRPGAKLLLAEPCLHVPRRDFDKTVVLAEHAGLKVVARPSIRFSQTVLLEKQAV